MLSGIKWSIDAWKLIQLWCVPAACITRVEGRGILLMIMMIHKFSKIWLPSGSVSEPLERQVPSQLKLQTMYASDGL